MRRKNQCQIFTQYFSYLWGILRELPVGLVAYVIVIYIFIFTIPFYLYRKVVTYLAKLYDKSITSCITGLSATFNRDFDVYHEKSHHTSVACLRMKGEVMDVTSLQKVFLDRVVNKKKEDNPGKLAYPKLQQHYTRFMGYSFFKWDLNFDIKNHVTSYHSDKEFIVTRKALVEIWEHLMVKPYSRDRSPWEVVVVSNYVPESEEVNPPDWFIFLRLHHGLADGLWFERILTSLFQATYKPTFVTKLVSSVTPFQKFIMNVRCLIFGPYDLLNRAIRSREDYHCLHFPQHNLSKSFFLAEGPHIPVGTIKQLKNHYGVAFTTILLSIICGGMRKFMRRRGMPIPQLYSLGIPFPKPKEPQDKMGNDFYLIVVDLPIHLAQMRDRVLTIQSNLNSLRYSSYMQMLDIILAQLTNLPSPILRAITRKSLFSASYSTLPGPEGSERANWFGNVELIDANFSHGMATDSLGLAFSTVTFTGNLRMTVFADRNLVGSRLKTNEILDCLMEEYLELKRSLNPVK